MKKNKLLIRIICIVAAVLLVLGTVAACFADEFILPELTDTTVVAKINGTEITWGECKSYYDSYVSQYGAYYDLSDPLNENLFRAVSLEEVLYEKELALMIETNGLAMTDEEIAVAKEQANLEWEQNVKSYISSNYSFTDATTDEEKAAARTAAEEFFLQNYGFTKDSYIESYAKSVGNNKLYDYICKDITVTDDEVKASREATVAADKAIYENDLEGYCTASANAEMMAYYSYMYTGVYDLVLPSYRPAGFRSVKHILLNVDEALMTTYTNAQASLEEQKSTLEAGEELPEGTVVVTEDDVAAAEAAILASVAETVETISQRFAAGEEFDQLITEYSKDTNVEMEVCAYTSTYYQSFTDAAMAIEAKGELSAPAITPYGVHIILYYDDIPAGPIEQTAEEFEALRSELLSEKQSNAFSAAVSEFVAGLNIEYQIANFEEAQAMLDARDAAATEEAPVEEVPTEEVPAEEAPAQ